MSLKAMASQKIGPLPSVDANIELISTLNCVVLAAITDGPMSRKIAVTPESRQAKSGRNVKPSRSSGGSCTSSWSRPPNSVPNASPTSARGPNCGSSQYPSVTPPTIEPRLKKLEAMAGTPNTLRAFKAPITRAASETSRMNGNMMRVRRAVSAAFAGSKPGARNATSSLEYTMPAMQIAPSTSSTSVVTLFASRHAAASPSRAIVLLKIVTNAVDRAPSANRSRSRFGIRNAAVKASIALPPPNSAANSCSRARPNSRLHITASPMMPAARVFRRSDGGASPLPLIVLAQRVPARWRGGRYRADIARAASESRARDRRPGVAPRRPCRRVRRRTAHGRRS